MALGPGKYDGALTEAREKLRCRGAALLVFGGEQGDGLDRKASCGKGDGFSCQCSIEDLLKLPGMLRFMANEIESHQKRGDILGGDGVN
jgi:hypothetical protein